MDPYFGVFQMYDTLKYDTNTGLMVERDNILIKPENSTPPSMYPDKVIYKTSLEKVAILDQEKGEFYDYKKIADTYILLTLSAGVLIASTIGALIYLSTRA